MIQQEERQAFLKTRLTGLKALWSVFDAFVVITRKVDNA